MASVAKMWTGAEWIDYNPLMWVYDEEEESYAWVDMLIRRRTEDGEWVDHGGGGGDTISLRSVWVGGVTQSEARFSVEFDGGYAGRVSVYEDGDLIAVSSEDELDQFYLGLVEVTGLTPNTRYTYKVEHQAEPGAEWVLHSTSRNFKTLHPAGVIVNQKFVATGCHSHNEQNESWDDATAYNPDFHIMTGDQNYTDETSEDPDKHIHWWKQFARVPSMSRFYANFATEQICSDHDGGGFGNGIFVPGIIANYLSWQQRVPRLPYPAGAPVGARYRTFDSGRICFILLDVRSAQRLSGQSDNPTGNGKTKPHAALGVEQMAWLENILHRPDYGTTIQAFVIITDFVTHDDPDTGGVLPAKPDSWSAYPLARSIISGWMEGKRGVVIAGDNHGLFGDEGEHNPLGFWPYIGCAGMNRGSGNDRGNSEWDYYWPPQGVEQPIKVYARIEIEDSEEELTIRMIGRDGEGQVDRFTVEHTWEL